MIPHPFTVPVALDSSAPISPSALLRIVYFSITANDPDVVVGLQRDTEVVPFILLGLQGIILGPSTHQLVFDSPSTIDALIDHIEAVAPGQTDPAYAFSMASLWVPGDALQDAKSKQITDGSNQLARGDLFRLSEDAFRGVWGFADDRFDESSLRSLFKTVSAGDASNFAPPLVAYSPLETTAFAQWCEAQFGGTSPSSIP